MKISKNWLLVAVVTSALAFVGTRVKADNADDIEGYNNYEALTYNNAVVDQIISQPGTIGGKSQTFWIVNIGDSTGSLVTDFSSASLAALGWTPTVGQNVTLSATWNPYHSIPEMVSASAVTVNSTGNSTWAAPGMHGGSQVVTIPNVLANTGQSDTGDPYLQIDQSMEGYLVEVQNVTISGEGSLTTFPTTNETMYLNDSANNQLTMYYWYTSYSCADALEGAPIPGAGSLSDASSYDVWGVMSAFPSVSGGVTTWQDELVPTAFVGIPEPSSFMLAGLGLLGLLAVIRRRHS